MTQPSLPSTPGQLRLIRGRANPNAGDETQLFLLAGDATAGPVWDIVPEPGVKLPHRRLLGAEQGFHLKILHINDLHGHITRFTPYGDQPVFSRIVRRLRELRSRVRGDPNAGVLAFSAGDDLVGAVFDELLGEDPASYQVHAGYRVYSAAGFDAAALGNHDLDMGSQLLAHAIRTDATFPLLSANLVDCPHLAGLIYPAAIFVVKGVRVGVIGLTTPGQLHLLPQSRLTVADPLHTLQNLLPALRPMCDVVILLSHLGYSTSATTATVQGVGDVELARSLPPGALHLIVGGHTHHALNEQGLSVRNIVNGIPIVQAGTLGRFVGEVDITVRRGAAVTNARLTPTASLPEDPEFEQRTVQPLVRKAHHLFARPLGRVANEPDLTTFAVRNTFSAGESAMANFIADSLVAYCRSQELTVDLAVVDQSTVRCGLPVGGELVFGDWFNVMPFADTIRLIHITGAELKALIQDNALRTDRPGEPHTERGFLHFSRQIRYRVLLGSSRSQARAVDITVEGRPIDEHLGRTFTVACSSFVRQPARDWERYAQEEMGLYLVDIRRWPHRDTGIFLRDALVAVIREHGGVTQEAGARRDGRVVFVEETEAVRSGEVRSRE